MEGQSSYRLQKAHGKRRQRWSWTLTVLVEKKWNMVTFFSNEIDWSESLLSFRKTIQIDKILVFILYQIIAVISLKI